MKKLEKIANVMMVIGVIIMVFGILLASAGATYVEGMIILTGFAIVAFGGVLSSYYAECKKFQKSRAKK